MHQLFLWALFKEIFSFIAVFENYPKYRFSILAFQPIFVLLKVTCLVPLFDRKLQVKKIAKIDHLGHFSGTFVDSKCVRSSLRSQYWMRLSYDFQTQCNDLKFPLLLQEILCSFLFWREKNCGTLLICCLWLWPYLIFAFWLELNWNQFGKLNWGKTGKAFVKKKDKKKNSET